MRGSGVPRRHVPLGWQSGLRGVVGQVVWGDWTDWCDWGPTGGAGLKRSGPMTTWNGSSGTAEH